MVSSTHSNSSQGSHTRPQSRRKSGRPAVRFCISWYRVFGILLVFYILLVAFVHLQMQSKTSGRTDQLTMQSLRSSGMVSIRKRGAAIPVQRQPTRTAPPAVNGVPAVVYAQYPNAKSCQKCPLDQTVIYYNPLVDQERIVCGQTIPPLSMIVLPAPCLESPRLFPVIPDLTSNGMPPVTTRFALMTGTAKPFECDVGCLEAGLPGSTAERYIDGTNWTLTFSMEGPKYYPFLNIGKNEFKKNHFYSTTSYKSDIPLPYYSAAEYTITSPALDYDTAIKGAVFLARNCMSDNNREQLVKKLQESVFRVDSLSLCVHNAEPPPGMNLGDKRQVMRAYLFYLAFENQNAEDYITEKFWGPLQAGTVPVYCKLLLRKAAKANILFHLGVSHDLTVGAPNIKDHAPNHSMIVVDDYPSVEELAEYLVKVSQDKELYESYHQWRKEPLPPHFQAKYDFTKTHSTCRTCRWAYAKLYGLGWNHDNQTLRELHVPRKVCLTDDGRIQRPVQEEWVAADGREVPFPKHGTSSCDVSSANRVLSVPGNLPDLIRTVFEQDGVMDLEITGSAKGYKLRLRTPLLDAGAHKIVEPGHSRLQNAKTRFTFLASPQDVVWAMADATTLEIQVDAPLRVRVIVEDIDVVHPGAEFEENYFGSRMKADFYAPVQSFTKS